MENPRVHVGLLSASKATVYFHGKFFHKGTIVTGAQSFSVYQDNIFWQGAIYPELIFIPKETEETHFELIDVPIGLDFHWQRVENQRFHGALLLRVNDHKLLFVNEVLIEEYLASVISSEMSAAASLELLKAHAVISRSWLLSQKKRRSRNLHTASSYSIPKQLNSGTKELIQWFDREDHSLFDVCADDHCQRYQGITRANTPQVEEAVRETSGEVLMYEGVLCDTRFSKCCGGAMEKFSTCWEQKDYHYLAGKRDWDSNLIDLTQEENAKKWICSKPESFCQVTDTRILTQVLNDYDQETSDFYRWKVSYTATELSDILYRKLGVDFGTVINLVPLKRGTSGRICRLQIVGTLDTRVIGKELLIRKALSETHLYSSAFIVEKSEGNPLSFTLYGAGWGHGVGLCQVGAAVLGEKGYSYQDILKHYYVGASLKKIVYSK